jgi:caa(3)-type oxidase subunit IV
MSVLPGARSPEPGAHDAHDVATHVRGYLIVFGMLMVLTLVTVAVASLQLPVGPAVAVGLTIAAIKAALVAAVFMHLRHERPLIYAALALTAVVVVSLFGITVWTEQTGHAPGTRFMAPFTVAEPAAAEETH